MPVTRRLASLALVIALAGCSCDDDAPRTASPAPPPETAADPTPPPPALPTTARTDLPALGPAITIAVDERAFDVSNATLVATWPEAEREAVARTRPLGDAAYPVVERHVDDASSDLIVPALTEAMRAVMAVETARASITHAEGTGQIFAIRAGADVPFGRILSAVYAAGAVGLSQPRLVLASADGERELHLVLPPPEPIDPSVAAALAAALAAVDGRERPPEVDAGTVARPMRVTFLLRDGGLVVRRGPVVYAPGCTDPAPDGAATPAIAAGSVSPITIGGCLDALDASSGITFGAPRTTRYADAVAILETLAARGEVSLTTVE